MYARLDSRFFLQNASVEIFVSNFIIYVHFKLCQDISSNLAELQSVSK